MSLNLTVLQGNLTADPEQRFGNTGTSIVTFSIAVNEKYQDREETSFVDCVAFGKTGETIMKFFTKGKEIIVNGRLRQSRWENKDDGSKRSKIEVILNNVGGFSFTDGGSRSEQPANAGGDSGGKDELF